MKQWYLVLSVTLILFSGLVFYANYDMDTFTVVPEQEEWTLLDYHAPETDPFPHHIIINVDTSHIVEISETLGGETNIIYTDDGSGRFTFESGETLLVVLRNPYGAEGVVVTTFYSDLWNYAAYTLFGAGSVLFFFWYLGSRGRHIVEI